MQEINVAHSSKPRKGIEHTREEVKNQLAMNDISPISSRAFALKLLVFAAFPN